MVQVHLWAAYRRLADGQAVVEVPGGTVGQILKELVRRHPALEPVIAAGVSVVVNGEVTVSRHATVPDGADLHLLQPMRGG